jgi:hypothetical protein
MSEIAQPGETELNDIKRQLTAHFVPAMNDELSRYCDLTTHVEYKARESNEHMQMWHLVVKFDNLPLETVVDIAQHLQFYWTNDRISMRLSDGRLAALGDGDDASAAWLEGNTFRVWLRVWAVGHDYGF